MTGYFDPWESINETSVRFNLIQDTVTWTQIDCLCPAPVKIFSGSKHSQSVLSILGFYIELTLFSALGFHSFRLFSMEITDHEIATSHEVTPGPLGLRGFDHPSFAPLVTATALFKISLAMRSEPGQRPLSKLL